MSSWSNQGTSPLSRQVNLPFKQRDWTLVTKTCLLKQWIVRSSISEIRRTSHYIRDHGPAPTSVSPNSWITRCIQSRVITTGCTRYYRVWHQPHTWRSWNYGWSAKAVWLNCRHRQKWKRSLMAPWRYRKASRDCARSSKSNRTSTWMECRARSWRLKRSE